MRPCPLLIEFVPGTRLRCEAPFTTGLPIVGNGPPGTFVVFSDGREVPLPSDQIVDSGQTEGAARVGFGGMRFDGIESGLLIFRRVKDLWPPRQLSPERGMRMTLEPAMVAGILVEGTRIWPPHEQMN